MEYILLFVFTILQFIDSWTTYKVISKGGRELNPIVRFFIDKLGLKTGLAVVKTATVGIVCAGTILGYFLAFPLAILCLVYGFVVYHNYLQMT